uniref:Uncharacterized protein n=1 Tax=Siphoviridae sp. ctBLh2 TaxID=2827803 RepID=A0A8S5S4A6_9CAUD|nr:MAG TPA: hypothetical protein [Siphoviridae sp. ctBLh2]
MWKYWSIFEPGNQRLNQRLSQRLKRKCVSRLCICDKPTRRPF